MRSPRPGGHGPAARDGVRTPTPTLRTDLPRDDFERQITRRCEYHRPFVGTHVPASEWAAWTDAPFDRVCLALRVAEGGADAS